MLHLTIPLIVDSLQDDINESIMWLQRKLNEGEYICMYDSIIGDIPSNMQNINSRKSK